jgi:replicative DNA helicase
MMNTNKPNYEEYLKSPEWQERAFAAKKAAGFRCQICYLHEDMTMLDAHHRTYDRLGTEYPEDVTVLCRDCHELFTRYDKLAKYGVRKLVGNRKTRSIDDLLAHNFNQSETSRSGILTGLTDLDDLLGGLNNSELITVAACSGMGKTAFVTKIASFVALQNRKRVVIFSLQLSATQLSHRIIVAKTRIPYQKIRQGDLSETELSKYHLEVGQMPQSSLLINDTADLTPSQIKTLSYQLFGKEGLDLIVVDGLELMQSEKYHRNRSQEINEIATSLKRLARQLDIPLLLTAQLSSFPQKKSNKRPMLEHLNENSGLEQISDIVMFIYRDEYYHSETERPNIAEIVVAKNRNGPSGMVDLYWNGKFATFGNLTRAEIQL